MTLGQREDRRGTHAIGEKTLPLMRTTDGASPVPNCCPTGRVLLGSMSDLGPTAASGAHPTRKHVGTAPTTLLLSCRSAARRDSSPVTRARATSSSCFSIMTSTPLQWSTQSVAGAGGRGRVAGSVHLGARLGGTAEMP